MACIFDAFALVALAIREPAAPEVADALRAGGGVVSAVNLAEAFDHLVRVRKYPAETVYRNFDPIIQEMLRVDAPDAVRARAAAALRRRHYRRRGSQLSMADCFALATVQEGDRLLTADPALLHAARAEGRDVLALPDSRGIRG